MQYETFKHYNNNNNNWGNNPFNQGQNEENIDDPFKSSASKNQYDIEDPFKTEYLYKNKPPQTQQQQQQQQKQQSNQFMDNPDFPQNTNQNDDFPQSTNQKDDFPQNPSLVSETKQQPSNQNPNKFDDINNPFGDPSFPTSNTNSNPFENNNKFLY